MEKPSDNNHDLEEIADLRGGPGILIFSPDARLLHMNRRGWELIRQINDAQYEVKANGGLLPAQVIEICSEIHKLLKPPAGSKDWEQLEVRRLAGGKQKPVLLRGFGLPDHRGIRHARVMILMESVGRQERAAQQAQERFRFTEREKTVVQNLVKGWTNKEIAVELGISEPTVKAHIKNIMDKTKCTTRTAIVAQVFYS
ncbi:MAG: helix-turn-helix domain-containing protein [Nitrospiraceae bacterium]